LKSVSGKEMCKALENHGWRLNRIRGSHHIYKKSGQPGSIPVPVHGTKTLKPKTQKSIMRSAGLSDADL